MDAPTITLGKHPTTLVKPRAIAAYAVQSQPSVGLLLDAWAKYAPEGDDEDRELHPKLLNAMQDTDCTATRCAALAVCWPSEKAWPSRKRPRPWKVRQPIDEYGAEVFDNLIGGGISPGDVITESWSALWWTLASVTSHNDVKAARDFSEAPSGG